MRKIFFLMFLHLYIGAGHGHAQYLTGTTMHDYSLDDLQNYEGAARRISDFRGKVLVIDFWTKYCAGCISTFPTVESLAQKFNDRVQFLFAGAILHPEDYQSTVEVFRRQQQRYDLKTPVVFDSIMFKGLDIYSVPHILIVDETGKIIASIYSDILNEQLLDDILAGNPLTVPEKAPGFIIKKQYQEGKEKTLVGDNKKASAMHYYAVLTEENPDLGYRSGNRDLGKGRRAMVSYNVGGLNLYARAYRPLDNYNVLPTSRIVLEMEAPERVTEKDYCFEMLVPEERLPDRELIMRGELDNALNLVSRMETRMHRCLALVAVKDTASLHSNGAPPLHEMKDGGLHGFRMVNQPVRTFAKSIASALSGRVVVVDEIEMYGNVDVDLELDLRIPPVERYRLALSKIGYDLIEVERLIEVLVIRDR